MSSDNTKQVKNSLSLLCDSSNLDFQLLQLPRDLQEILPTLELRSLQGNPESP